MGRRKITRGRATDGADSTSKGPASHLAQRMSARRAPLSHPGGGSAADGAHADPARRSSCGWRQNQRAGIGNGISPFTSPHRVGFIRPSARRDSMQKGNCRRWSWCRLASWSCGPFIVYGAAQRRIPCSTPSASSPQGYGGQSTYPRRATPARHPVIFASSVVTCRR